MLLFAGDMGLTDEMLWNLAKEYTNRSDLMTLASKLDGPDSSTSPMTALATSLTNNNNDINSAAYDLLRRRRVSQDNERVAYTNICKTLEDAEQKFLIWKVLKQMQTQGRIQDSPYEWAPTLQGAPTYDFAKFCEDLHEIENILGRGRGARAGAPPLNPPLRHIRSI